MFKINLLIIGTVFALWAGFTDNTKTGRTIKLSTATGSFLMPVEDVFMIAGRGLFVTGVIERGSIKSEDSIEIIGSGTSVKTVVKMIEVFRQSVKEAKQGESVGLLLSGIEKSQVTRGMIICQPGTAKAYTEFGCKLQLNTKEDGGRSTPVANKYRPQFLFRTALVSGEVYLPAGKETMQPGEDAEVNVILTTPTVMEKEMEFVIREGGKIVGKGKVVSVSK